MSSPTETVYRIRLPEVVSEVFDGEAVVVDLRQGRYYALSPLASEIWSRLERTSTLAALAVAAGERCGGVDAARDALRPFLDSLVAAGLLVEDRRRDGETAAGLEPIVADGDQRLDFETFTDLEELLVLDPIHELDETGWPLPADQRDR